MKTLSFFVLLFFSFELYSQEIIINEVMASNSGTDTLADGSTPDWLELLNRGTSPVNLKGYFIKDGSDLAGSNYVLPDITLAPGAFLVVYATGMPVTNVNGINTAPFKISAGNDIISLYNDKSVLQDQIKIKNIPVNVSVGRKNGDVSADYWFAATTIGQPNTELAYTTEYVAEPAFSLPAGKYLSTVLVGISSNDADVSIYYTTDGSVPSPDNGTLYSDSISLDISAPIRAVAYKASCLPSKTATNTYLILKREITLPIVCISVDPFDLFDPTYGMYMRGPYADTVSPFFGANYWMDWEKPVHVEIFETNGKLVVDVNAGAKIAGDRSRNNDQKSFSIHMRSKYGDDKIRYRLFEDKPIDEFDKITLRNSGGDFFKTQMRDGFISDLVKDLDFEHMAYRPAVLFINGTYWGIQNIREKISNEYLAENYGVDPDSVDLLEKHNKVKEGSNKDYVSLLEHIIANPVAEEASYRYVESQMEIQNFIDYMNTELYIVNIDWPGNNIRYWKSPGRKWRWILYDTDLGYDNCFWYCVYGSTESVSQKMLAYATQTGLADWPNPDWSTYMLRKMLTNDEFKTRFVNSMADRLNTTFKPSNVIPLIDSLQTDIHTEMFYHGQRWWVSYDDWLLEVQKLRDFGNNRPKYVWDDYVEFFGFNGLFDLQLAISSANAGTISLNSINVEKFPWLGNYFQNVPITLTAVPKPGCKFVRWEGSSTATDATITVDTDKLCSLTAVFEYDASILPLISINEIMYNDAGTLNSGDWVELHNSANSSFDISGWLLKNEKAHSSFTIPDGTIMQADQYLVFCKDSVMFKSAYSVPAIGNLGLDYSESRDVVSLFDRNDNLIDRLSYTDQFPWASKADGLGYSLELQAGSDASLPNSWRAATMGGTPNAINTVAPVDGAKTIVVTEICYNDGKDAPSGDWFEVLNTGSESVNMSEWLLEDAAGNKMIVPEGTILDPGQYLVFANSIIDFQFIFTAVLNVIPCPIKLGSDTETLLIFNNTDALVDSVTFSSHAPWPFVANGNGYTLALINANTDNSLPSNWSTGKLYGSPGEQNTITGLSPDELDIRTPVMAYPNPVRDILWVSAPLGTRIQLYNSLNQNLTPAQITVSSITEIDLSKLSNGVYYLTYTSRSFAGSLIVTK